jgi:pyruvate formate lyase activating enzyme
MVTDPNSFERLGVNDTFKKLLELKPFIDGVVITGGEPLIQAGLLVFIKALRNAGFKVKVDTNGMHPDVLKAILPFVNYVAMDIKTNDQYFEYFGDPEGFQKMIDSMNHIYTSGKDYEFRITVVEPFINHAVIGELGLALCGAKRVALQRPILDDVARPDIMQKAPTEANLQLYVDMLKKWGVQEVIVR